MVVDTSDIWRKAIALAPRWVRMALVSSIVVGECLSVLYKIFAPTLKTATAGSLDLSGVSTAEWPFLGVVLTMPVAFCWHSLMRALRGPTDLEKAEEYIAILKLSVSNSGFNKTTNKLFWGSLTEKLANRFAPGARPPSPTELAREIQEDEALTS